MLTTFASAQTSNRVLLESADKSVALSGELVDATDGRYQLKTIAGVLTMGVNAVSCTGDACPQVVPAFVAGAEVRLTSADGTVDLAGNLVKIVDDDFVVENPVLGTFTIRENIVDCAGPGCPTGVRFATDDPPVADTTDTAETIATTGASAEDADIGAEPDSGDEPDVETLVSVDEDPIDPATAGISFAGSDTVGLGLLPFLLEDYAASLDATAVTRLVSETETFVRYVGGDEDELGSVYVNATGSGDATDALETRSAVFGMTSRPISDEEARRLISAGAGELRNSEFETVVAVDSLAVITHPSNPVTELGMEQIGAIYLGQIDNWSQVGGPDAPITVLAREDGSSTRSVFETAIFDGEEPSLAERVVYPGGDNPEMAAAVKEDPFAIGYVGFAYSEGLNRIDLASECGITSTATSFAVKTEEYPLGRRLYLYNREDNMPEEAVDFLSYVLSPDADDAIAQSNFVNFAVERTPQSRSRLDRLYEGLTEQAAVRLADQLNDELGLWDRLSTTIRFRTASSRLDKKELNDIERLVDTVSEMPGGTRIAVVGFTDDVGSFESNLGLSRLRARNVADAIGKVAGDRIPDVQIDVLSFSELSPAVCNADANGRAINRRVEIWVREQA